MKAYSLTRRLVTAVLVVELVSALLLVGIAAVYESVSHFHAFDVLLHGRADSLLGAVQDAEDSQDNLMLDGSESLAPHRDIYLVRDDRGLIVGRSANWPDAEHFDTKPDTRLFRDLTINGRRYRVIRLAGTRVVDAGDDHGGIPRHVTVFYGARTLPVWESIEHTIAFYAGVSLLLLVASGFVMLWLVRCGLAPLHDLAIDAGRISVRAWAFTPTDEARAVRELAPLVAALEATLERLEQSFAQQTRFISDAAHELKTSVAVVKSSLQVLAMRPRSASEYHAGLDRIAQDCDRMESLVAAMLTLAGLEANTETAPAREVDLAAVVREVAEHLHTIAEVNGIAIDVRADTPVLVRADRDELRLLCSNLLHNALQYSEPASTVCVTATSTVTHAELRITDTGAGIAPDVLAHVFDRFYRGDSSRSRLTGGTGLGLAISRAIVQRAHGEIRLESTPGAGTTAIVTFPSPHETSHQLVAG